MDFLNSHLQAVKNNDKIISGDEKWKKTKCLKFIKKII